MPERTRVAPTRRRQTGHPSRRPIRRHAGGFPDRSRRGNGSTLGRFEADEASERLTLIEFTWNSDGRIQPVLFVWRELLH